MIQTTFHYAPPGLLMTPYAREGEDAPQSQVNHYQLNPVVTMLQQRILHDTELLSRMMSLHQADTATTTTSLSDTEQIDLVERSRPSYSYRARICGGEFVSDSRGNLLVTDNGQLLERGGEVIKTEEKDILDLSLEKNPRSKTRSPQFPGSPGLPDTEIILKNLSTNHHRPVFWNLLWALLRDQSFSSVLCWTDSKDLKFKILNFQFLADTWGSVKCKENMDINNIVKVLSYQIYRAIFHSSPDFRSLQFERFAVQDWC